MGYAEKAPAKSLFESAMGIVTKPFVIDVVAGMIAGLTATQERSRVGPPKLHASLFQRAASYKDLLLLARLGLVRLVPRQMRLRKDISTDRKDVILRQLVLK